MADLTKQLGLGLAVKQANQTPAGNTTGYNYSYTNPTGNKSIAVGVPLPGTMSTGGGMSYDVPQKSQAPVSPLGVTATQSLASPSSPTSVTNNVTDSFTGIPNKKKGNIANTAGQITPIATVPPITGQATSPTTPKPDMSGFREATMGQDAQFRSSYRKALMQPEALAPSPTGLSGAELEAYNELAQKDPGFEKMYKALSVQGWKAQIDYLTKAKADMEFRKSQEEKRVKMEGNSEAMAEMQSVARIEEAQRGVANLKQNIGYLGNQGQPGISSQKLDAVSNQVTLADKTLKNIIESERLSKKNREIGRESNAEVFTRQMKILQDDLDGKVNKTVQSALNQFNAAELEGKLDTIPEIEAFQQQLYAQLDYDLSSVIDTNIEARKFLIERYDKLAEGQKKAIEDQKKADAEYKKNENTVNEALSQAQGFYVNNNGDLIRDKFTGKAIPALPESKIYQNGSEMLVATPNRDGSYSFSRHQVGTNNGTPKWKQDENGNWYNEESPIRPDMQNPGQQPTNFYSNYRITQDYGAADTPNQMDVVPLVNGQKGTPGIDFAMPENTPVVSTVNGTVTHAGKNGQYGNQVIVTDAQGNKHMFSHLNSPGVQVGQQVTAGSNIGLSGNTGFSTGAHLDYRVKSSRGWEDPKQFLQSQQPTQYGAQEKIFDAIFNFSGGASKVSEGESKLMKTRAKTFAEMGLTPAQSIVKYKGFDITKPENAEMAQTYINIGDNLSKDVKPQAYEMTVSKYINNGDMKGLNDYVTRLTDDTVKKTYGNDAILSANNKVGNDRTSTVLSLIEKNKDKIGAFDGRVEDFISKFKTDPEYQKLKTILQMNQADARKYFAGSAVTESEMKALQDFIGGTTKMTAEGLTTMLKTLQDDRNNVYSSQRRGLEVPSTGESKTETTGTQMTPERIKNIQTLFKQSLNKQ